MKTFASKKKQSAPAVRKARPYVHHPMVPVQLAQQAEIRRILRSTHVQDKPLADQITPLVQRQEGPEEEEDLQMKTNTAVLQRQEVEEEEEPLQGKFESVQRQAPEEEEEEQVLQGKFTTSESPAHQFQNNDDEAENLTGMPNQLKTGLEQLSGMDLSGTRVHRNSYKPAQLNAVAFTQGQDIHVGPGQEKHLPHEGWHTVQQMQGRVKPTMQAKGVSINDDAVLEREADVMGAKALQIKGAEQAMMGSTHQGSTSLQRELAPRSSPPQHQSSAVSVQRRDPETSTAASTAKYERVPFTLAHLSNTWHDVVNNFVTWAMRGLEQANLPKDTPGKVFSRGLAEDFAWIVVGLAAGLAGPVGAPAVAMAKSLIDRKKEQIKLWTASNFSAIKAIIKKRLTRLSASWKQPAVKWPILRKVQIDLGPDASENSTVDTDRMRQLLKGALTGRPNDTDGDVSDRIRQNVQDRWAYFQEAVALEKRRVREARRKEGFFHWVGRGIKSIGYWDKDDESPGLNLGDAMKMPKGYVPPSRRGPAFRRPR